MDSRDLLNVVKRVSRFRASSEAQNIIIAQLEIYQAVGRETLVSGLQEVAQYKSCMHVHIDGGWVPLLGQQRFVVRTDHTVFLFFSVACSTSCNVLAKSLSPEISQA